jgi:membrane-associated protein
VNLQQFLAEVLRLVSDFTPNVGLALFLICFVGEAFVITIPVVFEMAWLAIGLQLNQGVLPVPDFLLMLLSAQLGRQAGALILYGISRRGTTFFSRFIARRLPRTLPHEGTTPGKLLSRIDSISPFGVAMGRMFWIRVPLTILLGARKKLKTLVLGIAISGTLYDCIYVALGAAFGSTLGPESDFILLYMMGGLAVLYVLVFGIRFAFKAIKKRLDRRAAQRQPQHLNQP